MSKPATKPCPICVAKARKKRIEMRAKLGCKPWRKGGRGRPPIYK